MSIQPRPRRRPLRLVGATLLLLATLGASTAFFFIPSLPERLVASPGRERPRRWSGDIADAVQAAGVISREFRVPGADPGVELAVAQIEPLHVEVITTGTHRRGSDFQIAFNRLAVAADAESAPRGTIIMLHGWGMDRWMVSLWALSLANEGYRVFMPDLRAHGRSTGEYVTFGMREAADLSALIDYLADTRLVAGELGVLGISMGATTALLAASEDERIRALVAMEPMCRLEDLLPRFVGRRMEEMRWYLTDARIAEAIGEAEPLVGCSLVDIDARRWMPEIGIPVLFIHGGEDHLIPAEFSRELHGLAREGSELIVVEDAGHYDLPRRVEEYAPAVAEWFDRHLAEPAG